MTYKINSEKEVFKTNLFSVKRVNLSFPDGKVRDYDMVDIQNAVTILPIDDAGLVYFVRQYRVGARNFLLELPAGKVEENEDPLKTAEREVREETGMSSSRMIPLGNFYMSPGYSSEYMYCYLAMGLSHDPLTPDADEFLDIVKLPLAEVRKMIDEHLIEDSKTLAVLLLAEKYLGV
jgi:ADP-ribose pyrophosphatase